MGEPRKREWFVPDDCIERAQQGDITVVDRDVALQAFYETETLLYRLGGVVKSQPVRVELADGRWVTVGYMFRHENYAPGLRQEHPQEPVVDEEPTEVLEPELAG